MDTYFILNDKIPNKFKKRVEALKIPPNWTNVRVSKDSLSKVQAIGYDSKKREQRIYHEAWIQKSKDEKYKNMNKLSKKYAEFDRYLDNLIRRRDLSKECITANVIKLIMVLNIRIGNDIYFEENGTCGISTLRKSNLKIIDSEYFLNFTGKKGIEHSKCIKSCRIKRFLDKMKKNKNERLFCYKDENEFIPISSIDINTFIKKRLGDNFTAKDLRTYSANKIFREYLWSMNTPTDEKRMYKNIREAIKYTANELGNTPKICKDSYIDPRLIERYINKR